MTILKINSQLCNMDHIYIIERATLDPLENDSNRAIEWQAYTFCHTVKEAKEFVDSGRIFTKEDCWPIGLTVEKKMNEFRYYLLKYKARPSE